MPIKILFIEDNAISQENLKSLLSDNSGISYEIITNLSLLNDELSSNSFTHLISTSKIGAEPLLNFTEFITIPTLILTDNYISNSNYSFTKNPLTYAKLFAFLCEKSIISDNTLEKYAMGDQDFMVQMKGHIIEEFEQNISEMPQLIESKNLVEIKSKIHQLVSKFSLLEMESTYNLSKEIDLNILEQPEQQIANTQQLLVDLEIALTQLK